MLQFPSSPFRNVLGGILFVLTVYTVGSTRSGLLQGLSARGPGRSRRAKGRLFKPQQVQ